MEDFSKQLAVIAKKNKYKQLDPVQEAYKAMYKKKEMEIKDRSIGYVNQVKTILKDIASEGFGSIEIFFSNREMRIGSMMPIEDVFYCSTHIIDMLKTHGVNITLQGWHYAAWWYGSKKHCYDRCIVITKKGALLKTK